MRNPFAPLFELRSAAIGSSQALWDYLSPGVTSLSGQAVSEATALSVAAVMTCVLIRSRSLASLPVAVYERIDERRKRPAVNFPLMRVLARPNSWQTRSELFGMLETHRVLRGNAYAWKNTGSVVGADGQTRQQLIELIPLHPDRVTVTQADELGGPLVYTLRRRTTGQVVPLPQDEVVHLRGMITDGVMGRSVLQDARELVGGALATQEHSNVTWASGGTPTVVLKHPKTLGDKARDGLEKRWQQIYGSSKDQRRVAVIEEGMTLEKISLTAGDMQFLDTRRFSRSEIAGWFLVPPHMIGDTEKQTSWGTGIEQQQIGFLNFTLRPDLVAWEERLTTDLIQNPARFYIKFNINGFLRGDSAARSAWYDRMVRMGAFTLNDVLAFEDMNPFDGGDEHVIDMNRAPIGAAPPVPGA